MNQNTGLKLLELPIHRVVRKNKVMFGSDVQSRYDVFFNRFIADMKHIGYDTMGRRVDADGGELLPITAYYPTSHFHDVINEMASQIPTDFSSTGAEQNFIRENLVEKSMLKNMLLELYVEQLLGVDGYVLMMPKIFDDGSIYFKFEVIPTEHVWVTRNDLTGDPIKITTQAEHSTYDTDNNTTVKYRKTVVYDMNNISIDYTMISSVTSREALGLIDSVSPNPFKSLELLPVVEFLGYSENKEPLACRVIETQLQLDNLNTNIENAINMNSNPLYTIKKTSRDWGGMKVGSGMTIPLIEDEEIQAITPKVQLQELTQRMEKRIGEIYNNVGMTPPDLRAKMFGTDSSKVVKIANGEFVATARIMTAFAKKSLRQIIKAILFLNNKKYTNEELNPPKEVLPYDLEQVFSTMALGLNLGLVDDEYFWSIYMPETDDSVKDRIKTFFKERQDLSMEDANVDNRAKQNMPNGNKEEAKKTDE